MGGGDGEDVEKESKRGKEGRKERKGNVIKCKSDRGGVIDDRIGRGRGGGRNGIFSINKFNIKKSVSKSGFIYICNIGICINGSNRVIFIDGGIFSTIWGIVWIRIKNSI